jgi:iron-sulfur cluster assembly accessory protein
MLNTNPQPETQPITTSETPLVVLSDAAAGKLADLVAAENNPAIGLRVYVYSGGCSGFRYGMMLEDQPSGEDVTVESKGIKVYVDAQSTQYIAGSEIDYLDTLMGAGFTVNNPNAVSACGCGSSFRTSESAGSPGACHH